MATNKKPNFKVAALRRLLSVVFITLLGVLLLIFLLRTNSTSDFVSPSLDEIDELSYNYSDSREKLGLPKQNKLSVHLEKQNQLPPIMDRDSIRNSCIIYKPIRN